jgi:hypothetical protein
MYSYLKSHPQVFFPQRKEPHFFGKDLEFQGRARMSFQEYEALYSDARPELAWGDASVFYLRSETAAQEIKGYHPQARIIIMLRDPLDVMHSFHSQRRFNGTEDIERFEDAVDAESDRRQGRRLPKRIGLRQGMFYRELVDFADQVQRYLDVFGPEQVHILLYDDFVADLSKTYKEVCSFLGIDASREPVFEKVNANKVVRYPWLRDLVHTKPKLLSVIGRALVPRESWRTAIRNAIFHLNMTNASRVPVSPEFRDRMRTELAPSIERLGHLINRDLRHWRGA